MSKISILLPYKENFSPQYAGSVSLYVKDTSLKSKNREDITVYGHTDLKKFTNLKYVNISLKKSILSSVSKYYVNSFIEHELKNPSKVIEIHNRPIYLNFIFNKNIGAKLVLYFHNDPLTMNGSKSLEDRQFLLKRSSKIIFNSEWSKKRFLNNMDSSVVNSEKLTVIYQSSDKKK